MPVLAPRPLRLRPRDGQPRCLLELAAQWTWRRLGLLVALNIALTLLLILLDVYAEVFK